MGGDGSSNTELNDGSSVRALVRGLRILSCFDVDHPAWLLIELSRQTGLHKATAHRLVKTLEAEGFLALDQEGKYHLGPRMQRAAYLTTSAMELARIAHPYMESVVSSTGESAILAFWTGEGPMIAHKVKNARPFQIVFQIGVTLTDLANAHSKLYYALGPDSRLSKVLAQPQARFTEHTIVDPDKIAEVLHKVRCEGIAYDYQEHRLGVCAVAVPVFDSAGKPRASLAIVAPPERFGPTEMRRFTKAVKETALALSHELGYREG